MLTKTEIGKTNKGYGYFSGSLRGMYAVDDFLPTDDISNLLLKMSAGEDTLQTCEQCPVGKVSTSSGNSCMEACPYSSPYVVSIMPEPADYFMPCINTPDCRIRCLDVFNAFEEALQATVQEPVFVSRLDVNVESKYFTKAETICEVYAS